MWVCQEVVDIEAGARDGRVMVGGSVGTMPVVLMSPEGQRGGALSGVPIDAGIDPLADERSG